MGILAIRRIAARFAVLWVVDVGAVVVEGRHAAHQTGQHSHGGASRRKPRRKNCICSLTMVWLVTGW